MSVTSVSFWSKFIEESLDHWFLRIFSTQTNRIGGFMVTGNENTIKLIYEIKDITLMVTLNISGTWNNGHNTTFRGSYPDDDCGQVCANGNAPCMIESKGNRMIIEDADALVYCKTFGDGH